MQRLQQWFNAVDKDRSGSITLQELVIMDWGSVKLSEDTARRLMNLFDNNHSGSITFDEYVCLHTFFSSAQSSFVQSDQDRSGNLDPREVMVALQRTGHNVSQETVNHACKVLSQGTGKINLDAFLRLSAILSNSQRSMEQNDLQKRGVVEFNYDKLVFFALSI